MKLLLQKMKKKSNIFIQIVLNKITFLKLKCQYQLNLLKDWRLPIEDLGNSHKFGILQEDQWKNFASP